MRVAQANVLSTQIGIYRRIFETTEERVSHLVTALRAQYETGNPVAQPMPVERRTRRGNDPDRQGDSDDDDMAPPPPPAAGAAAHVDQLTTGMRATTVSNNRPPRAPVRALAPPQLARAPPTTTPHNSSRTPVAGAAPTSSHATNRPPNAGDYVQSVHTCAQCSSDMQLEASNGDYKVACTRCDNKVP